MVQNQLSDSQLIQNFVNGDVSGVEVLFKRHQDRLFSYILFLVKNESVAEDIFQDTFCKIFDSLQKNKYKDNGRFFSWASRIAHNLVIDYFRNQKKMQTVSDSNQEDYLFLEENSGEDKLVNSQISSKIRKMLNMLPAEQREVVVMRNYLDMSFKEISQVAGISINTALGRMRYAIINLRKIAQEHQIVLEK